MLHYFLLLSLCIYYTKATIQRLCKSYYLCLFKLFRFNFANMTHEAINTYLKCYKLFSFQHRFTYRISLFLNKIMSTPNSPSQLRVRVLPTAQVNEHHNTRSNYTIVCPLDRAYTKYGDLTFKNVMGKLLNHVNYEDFMQPFNVFKQHLIYGNSLLVHLSKLLILFRNLTLTLIFNFTI